MDEPLEEQYFTWLYNQVASVRLKNPARTYWSLTRLLHKKEFEWSVPNDDNRVEDGRDLRHEFVTQHHIYRPDPEWVGMPCSMLEMLIGLSQRLSYEAEGDARDWFWELIENLDLEHFNDRAYHGDVSKYHINAILDRVIKRQYQPDGYGGLFPLHDPRRDQRKVELWYQMSNYLLERV